MLTLISLEAQCLTESMFTRMVGWREKDRERQEASARVMCDSEEKCRETLGIAMG